MKEIRGRILGLLFVVGGGCTLTPPERPNGHDDAGASSGATSGSGSVMGSSGASAGKSAASGGSSLGGTTTGVVPTTAGTGDVEAGAGGVATTDGGAATVGGAAGSGSGCDPECDHGMVCSSGSCACPDELTTCSKACVDLLTDAANCGACGHACADKCGGGHCYRTILDLPPTSSGVTQLASDASNIYFTVPSLGTVSRVSRSGGSPVVLASSQESPGSIAVDATNVYWTNTPTTYGAGSVMKRALSGGAPTALATEEPWPSFLAVNANNVYWSNYPPQPPIFMSVPIAGGEKIKFPEGDELTNSVEFSFDTTTLYWAGWYDKGGVFSTPLDGSGPIKSLATIDAYASLAKVYGNFVYFFAGSPTVPPTIKKVPKTGGAATDIAPLGGGYLEVDASGIYAGGSTTADGVKNSIVRVSFDGATITTLAVGASALYTMALGDTEVFWVDEDLQIKAAPKNP